MTFMGVSPSTSRTNARTKPAKIILRKILYCGSVFALLGGVALSVRVAAQEDRPQITPVERTAPRKKNADPRAVAVLQLTANGKASLVPIAILIGGKFWDATAYKADPVPMALESGTVYEAERAGSSEGLFTVNGALHSNSVNVSAPWIGTGTWVPAGSEKPKTALKAEIVPVGIDTSDAPPRLTRSGGTDKEAPPASAAPTSTPQSTSDKSSPSQPASQPGQSPSQPTPPQAGPPQAGSTSTPPAPPNNSKPSDAKPPDAKPTDVKRTDVKPADAKAPDSKTPEAKAPEQPSTPQSDSGASEGNRPRLRHGKPVDPLPEDEVPGYSKPGSVASAAAPASAAKTADSNVDKAAIRLIPAISDAAGPTPRSFAFEWLKDEEGERLQQMTAMAKEEVRAYVQAQAKARIMPSPKSAGPQAAKRGTAAKVSAGSKIGDPILENVHMNAFDLWNNNQPVIIFMADAHMPPPGTTHSAADSDLQYSILLVTNPDIYHSLHKIHVEVTDKYHLDMTPRLELVDALDADGDGRGELLFRESSDNASGWRIYRATPDKLWKLFDSLSPE